MANTKPVQIKDGPSHLDIIVSVNHAQSFERHKVRFTVCVNEPSNHASCYAWAVLNGNEREDGSGQNWILYGYISETDRDPNNQPATVAVDSLRRDLKGKKFEAFYTLRDRTGHLNIVE